MRCPGQGRAGQGSPGREGGSRHNGSNEPADSPQDGVSHARAVLRHAFWRHCHEALELIGLCFFENLHAGLRRRGRQLRKQHGGEARQTFQGHAPHAFELVELETWHIRIAACLAKHMGTARPQRLFQSTQVMLRTSKTVVLTRHPPAHHVQAMQPAPCTVTQPADIQRAMAHLIVFRFQR